MEQNPKQQAVERIKGATNILVTVSKNPTVDQLAACMGFTLLLNKLGKHATAVFSGAVPSTLEFLQPEKTLEQNTDSLRDFIIALDKSKADKLRYKVEDEVVRIFITPYRTSISDKDLEFSQGDFNVDVVVALGVTNKDDIDQAIVAHGRILHDAVVVSVTSGQSGSDIGAVNWHDESASSLSEMLVSVSESFQSGLLDGQMATAFLTGIVAETERFSNEKTSPKVMTMSAQLMAAGANQQLIATKLAPPPPEPAPVPEPAPEPVAPEVVEMSVEPYQPPIGSVPEPAPEPAPELPAPQQPSPDGEIDIHHEEESEDEIHIDEQGNLKRQEELKEAEEAERKKREDEERQKHEAEEAERHLLSQAPSPQEEASVAEEAEKPSQESASSLSGSSHKVIQPLSHPNDLNPLAAFAPLSDQLAANQPAVPAPEPVPAPTEPAVNLPPVVANAPTLEPTQPPQETAPAAEHAVRQPEPSWSLPAAGAPVSDTLSSLEQAVNSPHLQASESTPHALDDARQAVQTASLDSVPHPQPTQAVGSQIVDLSPRIEPTAPMPGVGDVLQQTASQHTDPLSPPPVPPPMMPQYMSPPQQPHP